MANINKCINTHTQHFIENFILARLSNSSMTVYISEQGLCTENVPSTPVVGSGIKLWPLSSALVLKFSVMCCTNYFIKHSVAVCQRSRGGVIDLTQSKQRYKLCSPLH